MGRCLCRAGIFALLLLPGAAACRSRAVSPRRVVLITIDTARADHFGSYGYSRPTTPEIDRLAAQGLRFTSFFTPIPTTEPAHASMLTGLHPRVHGMRYNGMTVTRPHLATLGTWFESRGYVTAAITSRVGLTPGMMGLDGFRYEIHPFVLGEEFTADETYREFRRFLTAEGRNPFFLWLHFYDPHSPYTPAPEFDKFENADRVNDEPLSYGFLPDGGCLSPDTLTRGIARYDGEILQADHFVGRVVRDLAADMPESEPPLVVITADHGEELDELVSSEGFVFDHGRYLYREALHVPMLVWWPGRVHPGLDSGLRDHTTLYGMLTRAFAGDAGWIGPALDQVFALRRTFELEPQPRKFLGAEDYAVVTAGDHAIFYGARQPEYFRTIADADRREPLTGEALSRLRVLASRLEDWKQKHPDASKGAAPIPEERLQILRSLGYLR